jgi:hypothetical protein
VEQTSKDRVSEDPRAMQMAEKSRLKHSVTNRVNVDAFQWQLEENDFEEGYEVGATDTRR